MSTEVQATWGVGASPTTVDGHQPLGSWPPIAVVPTTVDGHQPLGSWPPIAVVLLNWSVHMSPSQLSISISIATAKS